jgi:hypothetical protein
MGILRFLISLTGHGIFLEDRSNEDQEEQITDDHECEREDRVDSQASSSASKDFNRRFDEVYRLSGKIFDEQEVPRLRASGCDDEYIKTCRNRYIDKNMFMFMDSQGL